MTENVTNLAKEIDIKGQEVQSTKQMNPKRPTPTYIIKMEKVKEKERILKTAREKQLSHQKLFRPEGIGIKYSKY